MIRTPVGWTTPRRNVLRISQGKYPTGQGLRPREIGYAFHPSTMGPTYGAGRASRFAQIRMKYVILYMGSLALGGIGAWFIFRWGTEDRGQ